MKNIIIFFVLFYASFVVGHPGDHYQPRPAGGLLDDGEIVHQEAYRFEFSNYDDWEIKMQKDGYNKEDIEILLSREEFIKYKDGGSVESYKITYRSVGADVGGFMLYPSKDSARQASNHLPIIIYNHDGYLRDAKITFLEMIELYRLAEQGYVVLASYFRGNGPSSGRENFTYGDVTDAYNLVMLAEKNIPKADLSRVGIWGFGRGGVTAFHMLFNNGTFKTALMTNTPTNYALSHRFNYLDKNVFPYAVKNYKKNKDAAIKRISPINQVEKLDSKTPILLIHGAADSEVLASNTLNMAVELNKISQNYRVVIIESGSHNLIESRKTLRYEIERWFDEHLK